MTAALANVRRQISGRQTNKSGSFAMPLFSMAKDSVTSRAQISVATDRLGSLCPSRSAKKRRQFVLPVTSSSGSRRYRSIAGILQDGSIMKTLSLEFAAHPHQG